MGRPAGSRAGPGSSPVTARPARPDRPGGPSQTSRVWGPSPLQTGTTRRHALRIPLPTAQGPGQGPGRGRLDQRRARPPMGLLSQRPRRSTAPAGRCHDSEARAAGRPAAQAAGARTRRPLLRVKDRVATNPSRHSSAIRLHSCPRSRPGA